MNKLLDHLRNPRVLLAVFGAIMAVEEAVRPLLQGDTVNWGAVGTAAFGALFGFALKYPTDSTKRQVAAVRRDAAMGARISSEPPPRLTWNDDLPPVLDLPDEATPVERPRGGQQ